MSSARWLKGRGPGGRPPHRPPARDPASVPAPTVETVLGGDRGAVTAEAALALCSLVAVMTLVVAAVAGACAHLRCLDAAREGARLVARGEPDRAREAAAVIAPRGARIAIAVAGDQVRVDVSTPTVPGLPGLTFDAHAVGVLEPAALPASAGPARPFAGAPDTAVEAGDTSLGRSDEPTADTGRPPDDAAPGGTR